MEQTNRLLRIALTLEYLTILNCNVEGAVQRIRPKIMTVSAILFGLLPNMGQR
jgi:Cu/Ag efflux pump CusA